MTSIIERTGRKKRISRNLNTRTGEWLIVCGALETEINYIKGLIDEINKYSPNDKKIKYTLVPVSLDPKNLVEKIRREIMICSEQMDIRFSKIFVVFDKDDFINDDYNRAIQMCDNNGYIPIYSNECIELWFYLHFEYTDVSINRVDLINKINDIFKKHKIGKYQKNDPLIFDKLYKNGDILKAMIRAKKLKEIFSNDLSKAKQKPITNLDLLLDEIEKRQQEMGLKSIYEILKK